MRCEVRFEYDLPMCVEDDDVCIPVNLTIPMEFMIRDIEVVATDSPLSHLCSILVSFGEEVIYNGPIGKHGFIMSIMEMEERGEYALGILEQFKGIGVSLQPAGHALLLSLRNLQITPDGEIYDGGRDVAHIGAVVDQRAHFSRCHPFGWLVLGANSQTRRIPSPSVPEAIHENQGEDGYEEDPIGA